MNGFLLSCVFLFVMLAVAPAASAGPVDAVGQAAQACSIVGTGGADRLAGTAGEDRMCGRGGSDRVAGGGAADLLLGGGGGDLLQGKAGSDRLGGGPGADRLFGGAGADDLRGGAGPDALGGGLGSDLVAGGPGRDIAFYGQRGLTVRVTIGSGANDGVAGERDNVRADVEDIFSGRGNDVLIGNRRANRLFGGAGNDTLRGLGGNDVLAGGAGDDRIDARENGGSMSLVAQAGAVDQVVCGAGNDTALVDPADAVDPDCENVIGAAPPTTVPPTPGPVPALNRAPTGITLSGASVPENEPVGTDVGDLSVADPDAGQQHTFTLVAGAGDADNGKFEIAGSTLKIAAVLDFETDSTYEIRVAATDNGTPAMSVERQLIVTVTNVNEAPTGIALSNASVDENEPTGTTVGTLSASDPDAGDTHSFALVPGAGSDDNGSFEIVGNALRTGASFDYESKSSYTVRIRATDSGTPAMSVERELIVAVTDVNDAPAGLALSDDTLPENEPVGTDVGDLSVTDPDAGQQHTFTLVAGAGDADNAKFSISGSTLEVAQILDFEAQPSYSLRVRATDNGTPTMSVEREFTITVTDTLEPPIADDKSAAIDEDAAVTVTLSTSDPEGDNVTSFDITSETNGATGTVGPITCTATPEVCTADVQFTPAPNFNGTASFNYTATAAAQTSTPATVSITVAPVNDTPTALDGTRTTDEDTPLALNLADLVDDVETANGDLTYEIVTPPPGAEGSATATTFTPAADFNGTTSLTYKVTDRGDPDNCAAAPCDGPESSTTQTVSITVGPVNDAPVAAAASVSVAEDGSLPVDLAALASDVETADANLTFTIVTPPAHGTFATGTYTPAGDFNGPDSFTYRVTDRGDPDNCAAAPCDGPESSTTQTVSITVDSVNDAPVNFLPAGPVSAVQDTDRPLTGLSIVDVDAGADPVQLELAVDHGTLTVDTTVLGGVSAIDVTGNATSAATITASQAQINATLADPDGFVYHGDAPYTGPDTLTMVTDDLGHNGAGGPLSATDTLAISVNPPNAAPVAFAQSVSTAEDFVMTIPLSASDADGDDPLSFAIATGPSHGSLGAIRAVTCDHATPNFCTALVDYTSDADYFGPDSFTYTANDGISDSAPATVSISVEPVNDAPRLQDTEGGALVYVENDPATVITATTTVADDSPDLDTGTLTVDYATGGTADDRLEIRNQGTGLGQIGVSGAAVTFGGVAIGTFAGGTGTTPLVVTLNAAATPSAAQALIRNVTYRNVSDAPTAARTARFVLSDGDGATSNAATRSVAVTVVNDAPALANVEAGSLGYTENEAPKAITSTLTVGDPDSATLASATVQITGNYQSGADVLAAASQFSVNSSFNIGAGTLTLTGSATLANYQTILRSVTYANTSEVPSTAPRTVTFTVSDGAADSAPATRGITVTAVDDPPTLTTSGGSSAYTEQNPAAVIDGALALTDPDGGADPTGATVKIVSPTTGDSLVFGDQNGITGSFTAGTLTLSGAATRAQYEAALQSVRFANLTNDAPGTSRSVEFQITSPAASNTATKQVAITQVNDPPSTDPTDAAGSALEQTATAIDAGIVVSDPDSANLSGASVQITGGFQAGQDTLQFTNQSGITGSVSGSLLTLTGTATVAQYQSALRSVTYTNTSDTPNPATRTITFRVSDDETPSLQNAPQTRDLAVVPVNDAPTDAGESQNATGNTRLEVELTSGGSSLPKRTSATGNLLDNATDVDDAASALSIDTATVSDPPNGTVTVNADGSYVYTPDVGYTGPDSFTYKVKDDENAQSATSTVSITVANRVWYVKNDSAGTPDGRSETPFTTLGAADSAATATADTIYVLRGTGTTGLTDTVDLLAQQRLLGEAVNLVVAGTTLFTGTQANRPPLTGTVNLDDANTISGVAIAGSGAPAIAGATGDVAGTIADVTLSGAAGGLTLDATSGTWDLSDLAVTTTGGTAVNLTNAGTVNFTAAGTIALSSAAGPALVATATTALSGTIDSTTTNSSPTTGISLTGTTGALTLDDVNLTTTGTALVLNNANNVTVNNSGDADITSTSTAIDLTNGPTTQPGAPDVALDQVTSSGGTVGINIDGIGAGTFSAAGGTLSGHSAAELDINGGTGNITYPGTINNGTGLSVQITGRSGGTVALSGNINDTNDTGGGIDMSTNSGGTFNFSGTTKKLDTGTGAAFSSTGSNPTINLTGGGLDFDTTSGAGLTATGGGTLNVPTGASPNTIDAISATALNVANTTIGGSGLTFLRVSSGNATAAADPANGIVLSGTGTAGGLTVTGDGTLARNGSGGTIQNTTDDGIALTNANGVSLRSMNLTGDGDTAPSGPGEAENTVGEHAIQVSGGSNVVLSGALVSDPSGSGLVALNLGGTNRINSDSLFTSFAEGTRHGIYVNNVDTNMTLFEFDDSAMTNSLNDASMFWFSNTGTSNMTLHVHGGSVFENLDVQALTVAGGGTAATTGTLTSTIEDSVFQNARHFNTGTVNVSAENNVGVLVGSGARHVTTVRNNTFDNIAEDGTIANTSIIRTQNSGGRLEASVTGNVIRNINYQTAAGGRHVIGHVFEPVAYNAANYSNLVFENNTATNVTYTNTNREFVFIDYRNPASGGNVTVRNNTFTMPTSGSQQAIELRFRQTNASTVNLLATGNNGSFNTAVAMLDVDAEMAGTVNGTLTGNTLTNANATPGNTIDLASETAGTSTLCGNVSGNTLQSGTSTIGLTQTGTMRITQASASALATANSIPAGNVSVTGSPLFGQPACTTP